MAKTVTALYEDYATAQSAVEDLLNHDFRREDIRVLVQEALAKDGVRIAEEDTSGVAAGVGIGAALGGVGGLVLGLTAFPLLAALVSAGVGVAAGGVMGLLAEMGLPEDEAQYYAAGVRRGGVLITVHAADDVAECAASVLATHHPMQALTSSQTLHYPSWNPARSRAPRRGQRGRPAAVTCSTPGDAICQTATPPRQSVSCCAPVSGPSPDAHACLQQALLFSHRLQDLPPLGDPWDKGFTSFRLQCSFAQGVVVY